MHTMKSELKKWYLLCKYMHTSSSVCWKVGSCFFFCITGIFFRGWCWLFFGGRQEEVLFWAFFLRKKSTSYPLPLVTKPTSSETQEFVKWGKRDCAVILKGMGAPSKVLTEAFIPWQCWTKGVSCKECTRVPWDKARPRLNEGVWGGSDFCYQCN